MLAASVSFVALCGCSSGSTRSATTTTAPDSGSGVALQDLGAVPFQVRCQGNEYTLLGIPSDGHTLLAFVSASGQVLSPVSFHSDVEVVDQRGVRIFKRSDDKSATAPVEPGTRKCSFKLSATDNRDNTYYGTGSATAVFATTAP